MAQIGVPINGIVYEASEASRWFYGRTNGVFSSDNDLKVSSAGQMKLSVSAGAAFMSANRFNGVMYTSDTPVELSLDIAESVLNRIDRVVIRWNVAQIGVHPYLVIKKGTPASSPVAPAVERTASVWELGRADIYVRAGALSITNADITDLTLNEAVCGLVRDGIERIPTTELYNAWWAWFNALKLDAETKASAFSAWMQTFMSSNEASFATWLANFKSSADTNFNTWFTTFKTTNDNLFNTWFAAVRGQLSEDAAGNLYNMIEDRTSFVYKCTGTDDTKAIHDIINNFFTNETSMAMKLIISGTMGIGAMQYGNHLISIRATNTRSAVLTLDFSNCNIPKITAADRTFIAIMSSTARIIIKELIVNTTGNAIYTSSANNCTFINCKLTSATTSVSLENATNNIFTNCIITTTATTLVGAVRMNGNSNNNKFTNCIITGYSYGLLSQNDNNNNNSFTNCRISSTNDSSVQFYNGINNNNNFTNCIISSTNSYGIRFNAGYNDNNNFTNCTVTSANYAVNFYGGNNNNNRFTNCDITSESSHGMWVGNSNGTVFDKCKIASFVNVGAYITGDNTIFKSCTIAGRTYSARIVSANNNIFDTCTMTSSGDSSVPYGIHLSNSSGNKFNKCRTYYCDNGLHLDNARYNTFADCIIDGAINGVQTVDDCTGTNFNSCVLGNSQALQGTYITEDSYGIINFTTCTFSGGDGMRVATAKTDAYITLIGCSFGNIGHNIIQTTTASTVRWHIVGNNFSQASLVIDGTTTALYKTGSASMYFPQYANKFNVTVITPITFSALSSFAEGRVAQIEDFTNEAETETEADAKILGDSE